MPRDCAPPPPLDPVASLLLAADVDAAAVDDCGKEDVDDDAVDMVGSGTGKCVVGSGGGGGGGGTDRGKSNREAG
jgi:hypothetical protein